MRTRLGKRERCCLSRQGFVDAEVIGLMSFATPSPLSPMGRIAGPAPYSPLDGQPQGIALSGS
eukprot:4494065-Prymnesium_polylepis.1